MSASTDVAHDAVHVCILPHDSWMGAHLIVVGNMTIGELTSAASLPPPMTILSCPHDAQMISLRYVKSYPSASVERIIIKVPHLLHDCFAWKWLDPA